MVWSQGSTQQPIAGLCHKLSPACLSCKTMSTFNILIHFLSKIFMDDGYLAIRLGRIRISSLLFQQL